MLNKRTKKVTFRALKYLQKAKFFQKNLKSVRAQDIPRIPPPALRDWGATPAILWGYHIIPAVLSNLKFYGYDKHTQIPADFHPRRVQGVERYFANPYHPQRADGQVFLRLWR